MYVTIRYKLIWCYFCYIATLKMMCVVVLNAFVIYLSRYNSIDSTNSVNSGHEFPQIMTDMLYCLKHVWKQPLFFYFCLVSLAAHILHTSVFTCKSWLVKLLAIICLPQMLFSLLNVLLIAFKRLSFLSYMGPKRIYSAVLDQWCLFSFRDSSIILQLLKSLSYSIASCSWEGREYRDGVEWTSSPCTKCRCRNGRTECLVAECQPVTCKAVSNNPELSDVLCVFDLMVIVKAKHSDACLDV